MHRRIVTNDFLLKIGKKETDSCSFCADSTETLMHLFWDCRSTQTFWNNVSQWTSEILIWLDRRAHTDNHSLHNRAYKGTSSLYDRADHRYPLTLQSGSHRYQLASKSGSHRYPLIFFSLSFFFNRAHTDTRSLQNQAHRYPLTLKSGSHRYPLTSKSGSHGYPLISFNRAHKDTHHFIIGITKIPSLHTSGWRRTH